MGLSKGIGGEGSRTKGRVGNDKTSRNLLLGNGKVFYHSQDSILLSLIMVVWEFW